MNLFKQASKKESTGLFVPQAGGYKELTIDVGNGSINDVSRALGYHPDQTVNYTGWDSKDKGTGIEFVLLEIFSWRIICVFTERHVVSVSALKVASFLQGFDPNRTYSSLDIEGFLRDGIENGSLTVDFLSKVLKLEGAEPNGVSFARSIELYLYFSGGVLVDFRSSNGLNDMARMMKNDNPRLMALYEQDAREHWEEDISSIIREINNQAEAFGHTPGAFTSEYLHLHKNPSGTYNFRMLMVCHHDEEISLEEFKRINHGRYRKLPQNLDSYTKEVTRYKSGRFTYEFHDDGTLHTSYLS